jgi:hypothetical protein
MRSKIHRRSAFGRFCFVLPNKNQCTKETTTAKSLLVGFSLFASSFHLEKRARPRSFRFPIVGNSQAPTKPPPVPLSRETEPIERRRGRCASTCRRFILFPILLCLALSLVKFVTVCGCVQVADARGSGRADGSTLVERSTASLDAEARARAVVVSVDSKAPT